MERNEKIELLENIVSASKEFRFKTDEILNIRDYYTGRKSININFIALIETLCECDIPQEYLDRILLTDEELKELEEDQEDY